MALFLRIIQHLLPDAAAWRITLTKALRKFFQGLAAFFVFPREFIDLVFWDLFPSTTRELSRWEFQFGLRGIGTEAERRVALDAAWKARGGQSRSYIEGVLRSYGFDVYVHEWWSSGPPYVARDPRVFINQPSTRLEPHYLVNLDLNDTPAPAVPDDSAKWPYFFYIAASSLVLGTRAHVVASKRAELERLVLQLKPAHLWAVMHVKYVDQIGAFAPSSQGLGGGAYGGQAFGA